MKKISWQGVHVSATRSECEAEIYAGAPRGNRRTRKLIAIRVANAARAAAAVGHKRIIGRIDPPGYRVERVEATA